MDNIFKDNENHKTIIEIDNAGMEMNACYCCKSRYGIRQDLKLGCDNRSSTICICEKCLVKLYNVIDDHIKVIGGNKK